MTKLAKQIYSIVIKCVPDRKVAKENKHEMLRYICPSGTDLKAIGLNCQEALNLALSHINSTPVDSLNGKSPLEACKFFYPDLYEALNKFGIVEIPKDEIILKPYLLKLATSFLLPLVSLL